MSNYTTLKTTINANIRQNGNQEITGKILNSVLTAMVNTLGEEYQFAGIAIMETDPGTPDAKVFYIAKGKGTYTNFGGLEVTEDEVVFLVWDKAWHKVATGIAADAKLKEAVTELTEIAGKVDTKQDIIPDLEAIREGAGKGNEASSTIASIVEAGYVFAGIATPETNPGTPDTKVFYIANGKGTYTSFSGLEVTEDEVVALCWDSLWNKVATGIASQAKLSELDWKTEDISKESADDESDAIIYEDNYGNEVGRINAEGADFKNLKSNGVAVITDVSDKQDKINQISESVTTSEEEEQVFSNDDETEIYVKIGSYGIKARGIYDLNGNPIGGGGGVRIFNPYVGLDFSNTINSQTHEHCFTATGNNSLANSFKRGIRVFACSHYQPAIPRFPFSGWSVQYQDYTSVEDLTLTMRTSSGSIPSFAVDGETINTDTLPQIANAEHPLISGMPGHFNLLGCLWGEPGHNLGNANAGGTLTPSEYASWKESHALVTRESLKAALEVESNWQFGKALAFGTINHNYNSTLIKGILDEFPTYFKAMELFNQGYGKHYNQRFRDAYDELLRQGYKIWGTSVVDWQGDWATWNFIDDTDKAEWTAKYNALPSSEKAQYADAQAYYMAVGRYQIDRGMNVVLMPKNYESLEPQAIAREVVKAYNGGRYYMVGIGNHTMTLLVESGVITFKVSDIADTIKVITASGTTTYNGRDAIQYAPNNTDKYVRFEAEWSDGDFVYSNPCWIN